MKKVFYFTNIFPLYRESIWQLLRDEKSYDFHFFFSNQNLSGIKSISSTHHNKYHEIKNHFFLGRLIWQSKFLKDLINNKPDILILLGEMNVISNWVLAIFGKLFDTKVYYWGHGIYGNESILKRLFRFLFLKLAYGHILYGEWAKTKLIHIGFDKEKLHVVYNSLNYDSQKKHFEKLLKHPLPKKVYRLIFIGRLTKTKKIDQLLKALGKISNQIKYELNIVGDGLEKPYLINLKNELGLSNINFLGPIYEEKALSELIFNSNVCVSPGNIGLTAMHSLSYGTPVITHNDFKNQMPEAEAITENINGLFFKKDNIEDLAEKILKSSEIKFDKHIVRSVINEKYNPNFQKKIFDNLILKC